jgi:hypothetical protein
LLTKKVLVFVFNLSGHIVKYFGIGMRVFVRLLVLVAAIAATSSVLFLRQGGFGGGHGDFDKVIFVLALPWSEIPWPEFLTKHDFVWLVGLPLLLNVATVLVLAVAVRARQQQSS